MLAYNLSFEGVIIDINNTAVKTLGYSDKAELIGKPLIPTIYAPASHDKAKRLIERWKEEKVIKNEELQIITKGGETIDVLLNADTIFDHNGTPMHSLSTHLDISERKQAEMRLALNAQLLNILNRPNTFEQVVEDLLAKIKEYTGFDAVGIRLRQGKDFPYYVQNGFSSEFIRVGNSLFCLADGATQHDETGQPVLEECTCGLVVSGRAPTEHPLFTANGSFWCNDTTPLLDLTREEDPRHHPRNRCIHEGYASVALMPLRSGKEIIGLLQLNDRSTGRFTPESISFFEDIGNSIGIAFSRMNQETAIRQAQKMEAIGNLAGGIAHDFNNILSSIIGYTELALDDVSKGTLLEDSMQEVYSAGKRAKDLVKHILAFARQSDEKLSPIQPMVIAKEVTNFIRSTIPITIEIQEDIKSESLILGDSTQVHQILMNLCTNAAYAMEDSGGTLHLSLKDVFVDKEKLSIGMKPGDYIEIMVSDTGTGIAPEIIDSIFEPYFTTKAQGEGTGIGLAMVQGIVETYGGKINVISQLGKGTTFTIYLPITKKRSGGGDYVPEQLPMGTERILYNYRSNLALVQRCGGMRNA